MDQNPEERRLLRDSIYGITKPVIKRLGKKAGVAKISGLVYAEVRGILQDFLNDQIRKMIIVMEHSKRKTITVDDIRYVFDGKIYGEVTSAKPCKVWSGKKSKDYMKQLQREVKFYQNQSECLFIPKGAFEKLIREIIQNYRTDVRVQANAFLTLQYTIEEKLTNLLEAAMLLTVHSGRMTMHPKDLQLATRIASLVSPMMARHN